MSKTRAVKIQEWIAYHALIIASALPSVWLGLPLDWRQSLPHDTMPIMALVTGALGLVGKVCQIVAESREAKASTVPTSENLSQK